MSLPLSSIIHPAPCCARITPTRTSGFRSALDRVVQGLRDARNGLAQRLPVHERLPDFDAATLRDIGISHAPASWTPHERNADWWR
jgi:hypothetical protein